MSEKDATHVLVERAFWWLVGIFGTLFTAGITAGIAVLWSMNGSIITLNERVGTVVERTATQEERGRVFGEELGRVREMIAGVIERLARVEAKQEQAPRRSR